MTWYKRTSQVEHHLGYMCDMTVSMQSSIDDSDLDHCFHRGGRSLPRRRSSQLPLGLQTELGREKVSEGARARARERDRERDRVSIEREREREIVRFPPGTSFTPLVLEARVKWFSPVPDETTGTDSPYSVVPVPKRHICLLPLRGDGRNLDY